MASGGPPELTVRLPEQSGLPSTVNLFDGGRLIDFLLLTVKACEFLSCLFYLQKPLRYYVKGLGHVYIGQMGDEDADTKLTIALMKCNMGSAVPGGSTLTVKNAVHSLKPKGVFCVGFCGGMNSRKARLGDVVVSTKLITYAPVKVTKDGIQARGTIVPLNKNLNDIIRHAGDGWRPPLKYSKQAGKVVNGVMLSGPELVNDVGERNRLMEAYPEAVGIEMEGEGVYAAAHDLQLEWVVVKGISDYADGTKSDTEDWKPFASVMAASVVANILSNSVIFEDWPHFGGPSATEQRSAVDSKRARTEPSLRSLPNQEHKVKLGQVSDDDSEKLARLLGDSWEKLGRRLNVSNSDLTGLRRNIQEFSDLSEKAREMLRKWKCGEGRSASYQVLFNALCHECVQRRDLAEEICCE